MHRRSLFAGMAAAMFCGTSARTAMAQPLLADPSPTAIDAEVMRLRGSMERELGPRYQASRLNEAHWVPLAMDAAAQSSVALPRPGLVVVADRNPAVQGLVVMMIRDDAPWTVVGGASVSTGKPGARDHFLTPLGVFPNTADILGFRAQGTRNENGIRGYGVRGMRVWDLGWQGADRGDGRIAPGGMRLAMHATDPDRLEQRLGSRASQGCVRLSGPLNLFLDRHGIIDRLQEQAAVGDRRFAALLRSDRTPSAYAGDALVVIDSSRRG